jgi:hypothetical protein
LDRRVPYRAQQECVISTEGKGAEVEKTPHFGATTIAGSTTQLG